MKEDKAAPQWGDSVRQIEDERIKQLMEVNDRLRQKIKFLKERNNLLVKENHTLRNCYRELRDRYLALAAATIDPTREDEFDAMLKEEGL